MTSLTLYHNPRCSKSRQALALLRERDLEPKLRLYLEQPPNTEELQQLLALLDATPRALLREGEALYRELGLDRALPDAELLRYLAAHPSLLQRPIAVSAERAVIGRPPERILELLS
ncbi:MAG: arsenate reductase (glutaredoxin) [Pseudomonadales bacterium]|jgi:arsenate reductase|nr:arsenate reductase (glutaredoxin) [Pseudomonadales bacterium]